MTPDQEAEALANARARAIGEGRMRSGVCVSFGLATGDKVPCPSCRGNVNLDLFACCIHGVCTPASSVPGVACCVGCKEYVARD